MILNHKHKHLTPWGFIHKRICYIHPSLNCLPCFLSSQIKFVLNPLCGITLQNKFLSLIFHPCLHSSFTKRVSHLVMYFSSSGSGCPTSVCVDVHIYVIKNNFMQQDLSTQFPKSVISNWNF